MAPLLGWITPALRNKEQNDAHDLAMQGVMRRHSLPPVALAKGERIMLTDTWKDPNVVADIGFAFTGFRQLTGSCVGVSTGNWISTLSFVQRKLNQTKAFICFWPFNYGRTRFNEGDRGQGEGASDSVAGDVITKEGYFDIEQPGLPTFNKSDGLALTKQQELQYSDGNSSLVTKWLALAKTHTGAKATCNNFEDIWNAVGNGYPVIDGCDNFVGNGKIVGSGVNAYARGQYDNRGGHSTCFLGIYDHPNDGRLVAYSNQWDGKTYPTDQTGLGRCCVWVPEAEVNKEFRSGGMGGGETMALSHVDWFPPQDLLDWYA